MFRSLVANRRIQVTGLIPDTAWHQLPFLCEQQTWHPSSGTEGKANTRLSAFSVVTWAAGKVLVRARPVTHS